MSEFPKHPSQREIERAEAISLVIKGIGQVAAEAPVIVVEGQ